MIKELLKKIKQNKELRIGIFTESTLLTSFYEELQRNGWCDIVDDCPDDLTKIIKLTIKKRKQI